jgi:hypothetical protein
MPKCVGERSKGVPHDLTMTAHPEHGETRGLVALCAAGAHTATIVPPPLTGTPVLFGLMTHQAFFFAPYYIFLRVLIHLFMPFFPLLYSYYVFSFAPYILTCFGTFI